MNSKQRSRFVQRYQDVLQLGGALLFLVLAGFYVSMTGANIVVDGGYTKRVQF